MGPVQLLTGLAILTKYSFANHQISHLISPWSAILDSSNIRANSGHKCQAFKVELINPSGGQMLVQYLLPK